jgi:hypothetical protein
MMISSKKLIKTARKWQNLSPIKRNRESCRSMVADKGHFVVYTADQRRFMIPLLCLNSEIFRELLKLSEEEFGPPGDRPLTLSCDAVILEYIVRLIQRGASKDVEKASLMQGWIQLLIWGETKGQKNFGEGPIGKKIT